MSQSLVKKVKKGDRIAQKQFYLLHADYAMGIIFRYLPDMEDAKEVLQTSFIRIFGNIKKYDSEKSKITTWIHTIVVNESIRYLQKRKRLGYSEISDLDQWTTNDDVQSKLQLEDIKHQIEALPEKHRIILNLYYFDQFSHEEISRLLNINVSTSRSQLSRARSLLKNNIVSQF